MKYTTSKRKILQTIENISIFKRYAEMYLYGSQKKIFQHLGLIMEMKDY